MKNLFIFFIVFTSFYNYSDDGLMTFTSGLEAEAGMTAPGTTRSFSVSITNSNSTSTAGSFSHAFTNSDYAFLGGSFPGIGGDCGTDLTAGSSCTLMIEHSPASIGDSDAYLNLSYQMTTDSLGSNHIFEALIDGHSENLEVSGCSALAPVYLSQDVSSLLVDTTMVVTVNGYNFSSATQLSLTSGNISNFQVINPGTLQFTLTAPSSAGVADLNIQTECGSVLQSSAITYNGAAGGWNDLRTPGGLASASPSFTSAGVSGVTVDPSFGIQITTTQQSWNQYLKFDGVCDDVSKTFEIIVYRSGVDGLFMPSLINQATTVDPWPGTAAWNRQYIGIWVSGGNASSSWGTQGGEGGSFWNQNFAGVTFNAGRYYKYVFQAAGQSGNQVQIYEVDAGLNEISQLANYASNKAASPATSVCAGIIPYSNGVSDFYVTAVRSL